ncbi:MAG: PTS fructose transporter subunit IIA [Bulleidia sp.]|nr:PTS fructose transporter subunit IIA [Bulleidia sp.]
MEKRFVLATHGKFAEGIYDSLKIIMGEQPDFTTLCAYTTNENIEFQIEKIINDLEGFEIIIITDVFGGSVNNCFMKYIEKDNIHLITGLNLPLLMEIVCNKYLPVEEMIEKSIESATKAFKYCKHLDYSALSDDF